MAITTAAMERVESRRAASVATSSSSDGTERQQNGVTGGMSKERTHTGSTFEEPKDDEPEQSKPKSECGLSWRPSFSSETKCTCVILQPFANVSALFFCEA